MPRFAHSLARSALFVLGFAASAAGAQDPISEAETLLFMTDHLKNVVPAATLSYEFKRTGVAESGFDDIVELRVRAADGAKSVSGAFFTGPRKLSFPEIGHAEGN